MKSDLSDQLISAEYLSSGRFMFASAANWASHFPLGEELSLKRVIFHMDLSKAQEHFNSLPIGTSQIQLRLRDRWSGYIPTKCITVTHEEKTTVIWLVDSQGETSTNLLAVAAHDLKGPINSILGLTTVIQMMLKEKEPDLKEFARMVRMIKSSCNSSLDFTSDLIELSEVESNGKPLNQDEYHLLDFIEHFADTNRLIALRKNIKIRIVSRVSHEDTFVCNRPKIFRALSNLVSNATKFSQPGDTITLKIEKDEKFTIIRVIDEGVGMSKEILDNLFVKFGKSQRIGLAGEKSHGLGMSIVKQIVELHGGEIDVYSKVDKGTTVSLIFKNN